MPALASPKGAGKLIGDDFTALDFFCGSGLVTEALKPWFTTIWANDLCPKKCAVYTANFGAAHLVRGSITEIDGSQVPPADMAWGSFPCQDLSLAGNMEGLSNGSRSALYWEWVRILEEMNERYRPPVLCAENVVGFLVADEGKQFRRAYLALRKLGYFAGALVIDAIHFLPQSRPRSFLVAVKEGTPFDRESLTSHEPHPVYHGKAVLTAWKAANDPEWLWWLLPEPPQRTVTLADVVEFDATFNRCRETMRLIGMLSPLNRKKLDSALKAKTTMVGTGYRRIRWENGQRKQRLEIRFDGVAGCLRTPEGGSSRQILLVVKDGEVRTRLLTVRETARLMGARDSFKLPGSYNDGYRAMGDAVAVPVTRWLARHLLVKLAAAAARANERVVANARG